jgi:phage shock protein PspC (stress-responsive transcriptional regulator)
MSTLTRPVRGKLIAGVCAALAIRFGWSVTLIRVLAVASIVLPGPQVLIYVILWILIPREGSERARR